VSVFKIECFKNSYHSEEDRYLGCYSKHDTFAEALQEIDEIIPDMVEEKFPKVDMIDFSLHIHEHVLSCGDEIEICRYRVKHTSFTSGKHEIITFEGAENFEKIVREIIKKQSASLLLDESPPKLEDTIENVLKQNL